MLDLLRTSALALVFAAGAAVAQTLPPNERAQAPNTQQQPQTTPAQERQQPGTQEQERAKGQGEQPGKIDGELGNTAGRTPEKGQAIGLAPSEASTDGKTASEVPGATAQTEPAKFSEEIAAQDKLPIMGRPVLLTNEQRTSIWQALGKSDATASTKDEKIYAELGTFIPSPVAAEELPAGLTNSIPAVRGLKYVKADDKVLLVQPANGIVRGVIAQ